MPLSLMSHNVIRYHAAGTLTNKVLLLFVTLHLAALVTIRGLLVNVQLAPGV